MNQTENDPWALPYGPHLYVHIPFCRRKCTYCDFVSFPGQEAWHEAYVGAVVQEISNAGWARDSFATPGATLYVGGGTPTLLSPRLLASIVEAAADGADLGGAEVTIEANPGTVTVDGLGDLRSAGFNRLSLGVQSFSPAALALLGRIHSAEQAREAFAAARRAGFDSINLDLIFGLPGQALADWQRDLEEAVSLAPDHLSLYSLILEEGTPLARSVELGRRPVPDEDLAADMYTWTEGRLATAGYLHYEISNWARPGAMSRHNIAYWRDEEYLGCGVAAHSHRGRRRWANNSSIPEYIEAITTGRSPVAQEENVDEATSMGETMMLGLRLAAGMPWNVFRERFGVEMQTVYGPTLSELEEQGLLEVDAVGVRLTTRGRLLGNRVFCEFLRG